MKKIFNSIIKFLLFNNYFYKLFLNKKININFDGIENFNPLIPKKKSLKQLMLINSHYFSKNEDANIPLKMHSFDWLTDFKNIGGIELLKKSRLLILDWISCDYRLSTNVWNEIIIAKRIVNLSTNYDFFAASADNNFQKDIINSIYYNFKHLIFIYKFHNEKLEIDLEVTKSLLLVSKYFNKHKFFYEILNLINKQLKHQVNNIGFHKSINVNEHTKFIHQILEIKNILLYNNIQITKEMDMQINEMTSVLKNLFHLDLTLALFNGTNNKKKEYAYQIANLQKDIKTKNLYKIDDGIVVLSTGKTKIFFDITKPNSKLLNKKLHSGTLSFEMSHSGEKIITNCGSTDRYLEKNQIFFRYSAAHSTLTINNTNISELSEKNSYKRIPSNIKYSSEELEDYYRISGSHDGYSKNYNAIVKRVLNIHKSGEIIIGSDHIFSLKNNLKVHNFEIRFHLMPHCNSVITNNNKKIIIKTKNNLAWYFESSNSKLSIEDSVYMGDENSPLKTIQIVLTGKTEKIKNTINWRFEKVK